MDIAVVSLLTRYHSCISEHDDYGCYSWLRAHEAAGESQGVVPPVTAGTTVLRWWRGEGVNNYFGVLCTMNPFGLCRNTKTKHSDSYSRSLTSPTPYPTSLVYLLRAWTRLSSFCMFEDRFQQSNPDSLNHNILAP